MWIENKNSYRMRQVVCVILGVCAALVLTNAVQKRQEVVAAKNLSAAQEELSGEVFRFHVLANSDSDKDQKLKLKVRDAILSYMKESTIASKHLTVEESKEWAGTHLDEIEKAAMAVIQKEGYSYCVKAEVEECYFPDRKYGKLLFPKGYYEALRVEIGAGEGHNWWCVLYPTLCFTDSTCAVVEKESEEEIQDVLSKDTFETITVTSNNFKIKSFFYELFKGETSD